MAKTLTVAVIDTGIDTFTKKSKVSHVCKQGHKSFTGRDPLMDLNGHGTHIAGLINRNSGGGDYCMVSLQYYSDLNTGKQNLANMIAAVKYAINIHVDFINISGGGPEFVESEYLLIKSALDKGITVVVAAGNEHFNLDKECNYFPACYDPRVVSVGNVESEELLDKPNFVGPVVKRTIASTSNFGKRVTAWENGTDQLSDLPGGKVGTMTGTSQATAIRTGKLLRLKLSQ